MTFMPLPSRTRFSWTAQRPTSSTGRAAPGTFVVAVNCGHAGGTCFCVSMGTGPHVTKGFDLALTELLDGSGHRFVVEIGSEAGAAVLERVGYATATPVDCELADGLVARTASQMGRTVETDGIKELLYRSSRLLAAPSSCPSGRCSARRHRGSTRVSSCPLAGRWFS